MPTYEYRCKKCDQTLEVFQSFTDDSLTECPNCGGTLRKVFGNVGITFKGSGFYKTDSRSGTKSRSGSGSSSSDGSSTTSSSESTSSSGGSGGTNGSAGSGGSKGSGDKSPSATTSSSSS
ncbi:MAG TPA: FmdB family zinc ribbon protein [Acidimicrobiales bacterium]|jgi:putative FmdB family regulatory protein|nr:FmdB family zinc ribbon protein [Acidimicrobiales bacterium]